MKFKVQIKKVLESSYKWNENGTEVTFQANGEVSVVGNPYAEKPSEIKIEDHFKKPVLVTPVTLFDLKCNVKNIAKIAEIAQQQADAWVEKTYPEIE